MFNSLIDNKKCYVMSIFYHEIGHHIAAVALGFETESISVKFKNNHTEHEAHSKIYISKATLDIDSIRKYLRERIVILCAGVISQSIVEREIDLGSALCLWDAQSGASDKNKATELLHLLRNISHDESADYDESIYLEELMNFQNSIWEEAKDIISINIDNIILISDVMVKKFRVNEATTLSYDEIINIGIDVNKKS